MNYECRECGFHEVIWNSRDGVTPFGLACPACGKPEHYHVRWELDAYNPLHQLKPGDRYFANMTRERAREYAVANVDRAIASGLLPEVKRNDVIRQASNNYYGDGKAPDILVHMPH